MHEIKLKYETKFTRRWQQVTALIGELLSHSFVVNNTFQGPVHGKADPLSNHNNGQRFVAV